MDRLCKRHQLTLALALHTLPMQAQRHIPDAKWQQYTSGKDYGYARELEQFNTPKPSGFNSNNLQFLKNLFAFLSGPVGVVIVWTIIAVAAVYIVYMVIKHSDRGKKAKLIVQDGDNLPDDLAHHNWAEMLRQALKKGDERQAVRSSFMLLLQMMADKQLIGYRKDKTNYEYYRELAATPLAADFRQLSTQYEYVWYGQFALPNTGLDGYMSRFNKLRDQLK